MFYVNGHRVIQNYSAQSCKKKGKKYKKVRENNSDNVKPEIGTTKEREKSKYLLHSYNSGNKLCNFSFGLYHYGLNKRFSCK